MEKRKPKLDESFIKQIDDKDFVIYAGLLDVAHQKHLINVDVEILQFPSDENKQTAICKARVETVDGKKFSDIGDANPQNCNSKVAKHLIRMASTRAKARAFRDMDNIGMTALEELGDFNEIIGNEVETVKPSIRKNNVKQFPAKQIAVKKTTSVVNDKTVTSDKKEVKPEVEKKAPITKKAKPGNGNGKSKEQTAPKISAAQKNAVYNLARRRGISVADLEEMAKKTFHLPIEDITSTDASSFIRQLQQAS
jgi:hypothetical protein